MALHLLFTGPNDRESFNRCLNAMNPSEDQLLLLQDGVLHCMHKGESSKRLVEAVNCAVLIPDLHARGLEPMAHPDLERVDDAGFVELTEKHEQVISWL